MIRLYEGPGAGGVTQTEGRAVGPGLGAQDRESLFHRPRARCGDMKASGDSLCDSHTTVRMHLVPQNHTLRNGQSGKLRVLGASLPLENVKQHEAQRGL